jgi:serine/threonine protein kinase
MAMARPSADEVFDEAIRRTPGEDRAAYLDEACGGDTELRVRVDRLVQAFAEAGSFLESPAADLTDTTDHSSIAERPGMVIGHYKLLQQIGEGGFGVVFFAEQERPVKRRVALKVIKPGMDTRQVIARFEAERQALAMMDHPNIAKVYDAGATANGRPYFVMDLVKGVPISKYCDDHHLTPRQRLELFIPICQAVQHAHQKGIIHRDLKPSNVMVALYDGRSVPKIIDFGVAKATGPKLTDRTMFTEFGAVIGTFEYMSPEQAELNQLDVDTRSDIYSLGVLLYELLTGTTPLERRRLKDSALHEVLRLIREEEPPTPSTRISTAVDLPAVAANRGTEPARLSGLVHGELDWIVMKCLEKDRNRRYESASSLARDIERYLHDEPVQACPPSVAYRLKKFIRRNKVGALTGSAVVLALVVGLALATVGFMQAHEQAQISAAEAAKATAISELLQSALQSANPDHAKGNEYTVRQLLDDFSGGLANQLAGQPELEAQIRATIGNAYRGLRLFELAAAQFETALALQRRVDGQGAKYAGILMDYAQVVAERDHNVVEAEPIAREAIRIYRRAGVSGRPLVKALWMLQLQLAFRIENAQDAAEARSVYTEGQALVQEALAIARAEATEYPELANMLHRHAPLMSKQGDPVEAERCARQAVDMHRRLHGDEHLETAYGLADLGRVLRDRKKFRDAENAFRQALEIFRRYYGDENVGGVRDELRRVISAQKEPTDSKEQQPEPPEPVSNLTQAASSLAAKRSLRLAEEALQRELSDALKVIETGIDASPTNKSQQLALATTYRQVAEIDLKHGKVDDAIGHFRSAVAIASRLVSEDSTNSSYAEERARSQSSLAETLARANRVNESLAAFDAMMAMNEEAMAIFSREKWFIALVVETCARMSSALPLRASHTPDAVDQVRQLLVRGMKQLDSVDLASDVESSLKVAEMYTSVAQNLAAGAYADEIIRNEMDLYPNVAKNSAADMDSVAIVREYQNRLMALLQATLNRFPNEAGVREGVGHKLRLWAFALPWKGKYQPSAEQALKQAITTFEELTVDSPENLSAWHFLADTHYCLGRLYEWNAKTDEAEAAYRRAVELFDEHPESPLSNYHERANSYLGLAEFLVGMKRSTEAEAYYRKGIEVLAEPLGIQPDVTGVYARIAYYLTTIHREQDAARYLRKATLDTERLTDPNESANALYYIAVAQARLGDKAGYRSTCKMLGELPFNQLVGVTKSRPIWTLCLAPHAVDDFDQIVNRGQEFAATDKSHFGLYVWGAALYRAGQYELAAMRFQESIVAYANKPPANTDSMNYPRLFLAMTKWQLGLQDEARQVLAETLPDVDNELQSPSSAWNRRATLELLRGEAEALIEPKETNEAVENVEASQPAPATNSQQNLSHE